MNKLVLFCAFIAALCMLSSVNTPTDHIYATGSDWRVYGGTAASSRYSALDQINTQNAGQMQLAWEYHTGDTDPNNRSQIQCNPLIVNGILFGATSRSKVFAISAGTGKQIWKFDPFEVLGGENSWAGTCRGLTYWEEGNDKRILFAAGSFLFALDAHTGTLALEFGDGGKVDLRRDLDYAKDQFFIVSNTPGVIYKDMIIMGMRLSEGLDAAPGHIRAYDVRTGKRRWIFHTVPHPGEYGYDTWEDPDAWKRIGGANCWAGMSVDEERGIVFAATGSATYDFWGGYRLGKDLFSDCIIALDARTGKRIWHYQTVHHDIWDRDLPAPPNLVTVMHKGKPVDAVAQITKQGFIFVLDRETGEPLFPVKEMRVPPSALEGEKAWETQPVPAMPAPFMRQSFAESDINDVVPGAKDEILPQFRALQSGNMWNPPSLQGIVLFPGFDGGGEWGGAAFDPTSNWLYVNANEMPWIVKMVKKEPGQTVGQALYMANCANCHGADRRGNGNAFPPLTDIEKKFTSAQMDTLLKSGKGTMPSFRHIPEAERNQLARFLLDDLASGPQKEISAEELAFLPPFTMTGYNRFLTKDGYPAIKPPWGTLNAVNLNTGKIEWKVPLGAFDALTSRGIPPTGTENYGGPVCTAGGLVFIGASKDEKFRAFDKKTGQVLFETRLPAGGYATPAVYSVNGRQFVVIACGGGKMGTKSGDSYVAFRVVN
ncbi:MAG: PQQ-binding-like beta-propeller repeat protein [Saprospiraceae bacterium]|nr:PQQ-binding-like beta-propeller repeat protein [Saprospiraceae bacterium]